MEPLTVLKSFSYGSNEIELHVNMSIGIGGDKWPAAELFCSLISSPSWKEYFRSLFYGKKIIELGAGTGLVAILVDRIFKPDVITITDQLSHINLIKRNIEHNNCSKSIASVFDWLDLPISNVSYDIVFAFEW
jgi:hypothetical protein